jgi:hypothetical protein
MKTSTINRASKGQAMTEFVFMAFVAFIVLFVAIQMAPWTRVHGAGPVELPGHPLGHRPGK